MAVRVGARVGCYEVIAKIGEGGMGEVYRARDTKLGRDVALKLLPAAFVDDPDRLARFQREAHVLASLNHPNIASIYGLEQQASRPDASPAALVLELVDGPTIADLLDASRTKADRPGLPLDEALSIARQIAEALEAAHAQGIVHRDLKPANIKRRPDGTVKVLDFGLAKLADRLDGSLTSGASALSVAPTMTSPAMMTQAGIILGTAAYMSPEQAKGRSADQRSDMWAFGCVLFEMLTGRRAFPGDDFAETFSAVIKLEPDWNALPDETPAPVRRLLRRCLQKDPKRRLYAAADARLEIEDASNGSEPSLPVAAAPALRRQLRARELAAWTIAALASVIAGAVAWKHVGEVAPAREPLHLSIDLPEDSSVRSLALSPDGRSIVMAAQIDNKYQLWIRRLDSAEFRPLEGTDFGRVPFWSADGRSIGFFADAKLKTISATGGPARVLCETGPVGAAGGTWNRDGVILFARSDPSGLYRVSASGGECVGVTKPDPDVSNVFPEFLPDGHHFFYVVTRGDESKRGVYVASIEDPNGQRILADQSSVSYVASPGPARHDSIIFLRGDTLMMQRFDNGILETVGDPTPIATHASISNSAPQMAASAAPNGTLVYLANGESSQGRQLSWFDRAGKSVEQVSSSPEQIIGVALSPDGTTAAVDLRPSATAGNIWLRDLRRQTVSRFSQASWFSGAEVWSADGKRLAFAGVRPGSAATDLYWKAVGSADEHALLKSRFSKAPSDWSRDGHYLVYTQLDPTTSADIWVLRGPTEEPQGEHDAFPFADTQFNETQGQLSPDGRWMAYVSDESGQFEVYVRPFPSGDGKWRVSNAGGSEPRWRSNGRELFYQEGQLGTHHLMSVAVSSSASGAQALTLGAPTLLFEYRTNKLLPQANAFSYSPSADGQRFLLHHFTGNVKPTLDVLVNWQPEMAR